MREVMGPGIAELLAVLKAQGVPPTGPLFCHHRRLDPERFVFALSLPVAADIAAQGRVHAGLVPARTVACTVYSGGYEGLPAAWGEFMTWLEKSGRAPAADFLETYRVGPEASASPADWRTELQRPLAV